MENEDPDDVIRATWSATFERDEPQDEDCSPTRVCRNAREFSFEGFAEDGLDLQTAWRETLAREGKLRDSNESIRDLVLGRPPTS